MLRCTGVHVLSSLGGYDYTYKLTEPILCFHVSHKLILALWNFEPSDLKSKQKIKYQWDLVMRAVHYCSIVLHGTPNKYFWKQLRICQVWLHNKVISLLHCTEFLNEFKKQFLLFFAKDNATSCHNRISKPNSRACFKSTCTKEHKATMRMGNLLRALDTKNLFKKSQLPEWYSSKGDDTLNI